MAHATDIMQGLSNKLDARTIRWVTAAAGGALVLVAGRSSSSWTAAALAATGGVLLGRSLFGFGGLPLDDSDALRRAGSGPQPTTPRPAAAPRDPVDRASYESFPASDPPGFSSSTGAPKLKV